MKKMIDAEVIYVLKGVYRAERSDIADYMLRLLELIAIDNKDIIL